MKMTKAVLLLVLPIAFLGGCTKTTTVTTGSTDPEDYIINSLNYEVIAEVFADEVPDAVFTEGVRVPDFITEGSLNPVTSMYDVQCENGGLLSYTFSSSAGVTGTTISNAYTFDGCLLDGATITGIIEAEQRKSVSGEIIGTSAKFKKLLDGTLFSYFSAETDTITTDGVTKTWNVASGKSVKIPGTFTRDGGTISNYEMTDVGDVLKGTANVDVALGTTYGNVSFIKTGSIVTLSASDNSRVRIEDTGAVSLRGSDIGINGGYTVTNYGSEECRALLDGTVPCVIELDTFRMSVTGISPLQAANATLAVATTKLRVAQEEVGGAEVENESASEQLGVYITLGEADDDDLAFVSDAVTAATTALNIARAELAEAQANFDAAQAAVNALIS